MGKRRTLTAKRIFECFDQYSNRLSVMSYNIASMKKIMTKRNVNIFEAFREISLRNTIKTTSIIALDLPEDVTEYEDVKKYRLIIEDFNFGKSKNKNIKEEIQIKEEDNIDESLLE